MLINQIIPISICHTVNELHDVRLDDKLYVISKCTTQTPKNRLRYILQESTTVCVRELMKLSGSIRSCSGEVSAAGADK